MTEEIKLKLFEQMLALETGEDASYDMANGAYLMLKALGIETEYIFWAIGRTAK